MSVSPAEATPGNCGISGGEHRPLAEEKIALHPEEADGAQQQVPEALHPEAECSLLTAGGAELGSALLRAEMSDSFLLSCS